ncbi:MAG: DUF6569 family protein [Chloroflexota bacterium]
MDATIASYLSKLEFGEPQQYKNMAVIPAFTSLDTSPKYLTMKEAIDKKLLSVTEVSEGGSVPELKVQNRAGIAVLLLDGEEVAGAKQNRVLNTTILLKEKSVTVIPVSCTEQGRWSHASEEFESSEEMISPQIRMTKAASVSAALGSFGEYKSDQSAVWSEIEEMATRAKVSSPTGAMKDVYKNKTEDLDKYLSAFRPVPHQKGLMIFIDGKVVGLDFISLESAFEILHPKLVRSYAMDAFLRSRKSSAPPSKDVAKAFLQEVTKADEKEYESIGLGWDHRFEGKSIVGSALVYNDKVVHMAFFKVTRRSRKSQMEIHQRQWGFMGEADAEPPEEQVQRRVH